MKRRRSDGSPGLDLRGLRNRRPEAIRIWFESYFAVVHGFVQRRVAAQPGLADDVTQDTFLVALKQIHAFDPERGAMLPWLTYIARNCARKALRCARPEDPAEQVADGVESLPDLTAAPLPEARLEQAEIVDRVHAALSALDAHHQRVLESHYLLEQPLTQIAAAEGTTIAAVKSLLYRARLAFKTAFERAGESGHRATAWQGPVDPRSDEPSEGGAYGR